MKRYIIIVLFLCSFISHAQEGLQEVREKMTDQAPQKEIWTLQECLSYATEHNLTILSAQLDRSNAVVNHKQSKLERLPNLYGGVSQSLTNGYSIDPITSAYVNEQIHSTSTSLNTSVTLFQGNQLNNQIKQNELLVDQSSLYVKEAENNIILSITEAYLQALYYREAIYVAQNTLEGSNKEVETAKARYDAGAIAKKDYSDAVSQTASNKYNLIDSQNRYSAQVLVLKQLLELEPEVDFQIEEPDIDYNGSSIIQNKTEIYREALASLPEIKASELNVDIYEKDLDIAKGGYLPSLSLSGSLGSGYTSIQDLTFSDQFDLNFNQRVGLSLNIPIFSRGQVKAQVQTAKINIKRAEIDLRTEEKELYQKIETAWRNSVSAQEQITAAEAARNAARDSYALAQEQYEVGSINTTDLVLSQNLYTNAEQNYIQAKYLSILYNQLLQFYQGNEIKI
ncbi:TolC family protein [Salinimicrobium sp. TIG7-5_MAKvit]|uniref:TolC family protein n=1 Tax=Salinimicrobium sp. TIG7-5_MAKvit TaxID=3121289 RepID=UPI003C6E450A